MELGYFTMPLHPPGSVQADTMDHDLDQLATLDELGYKETWVGEHFTSVWENIPAPDMFIAKALGYTKNMVLGTGVSCIPNHNPLMLAHRIAQLDHMARGRFHWGIGSGGFPGDLEAFGYDFNNPSYRRMTKETIEVILQIWEDPQPGVYRSDFWEFTIPEPDDSFGMRFHMMPYQKPHPPIGVAGVSPKSDTLAMAGERGWIPMTINFVPPRIIKSHWEAVEQGARKVGRKADRSTWRIACEIFVADTTEEARKAVMEGTIARDFRDYFFHSLARYKLFDVFKKDPDMADSGVTLDYLLDNTWIVGSPDDVAHQIRQLYNDVGGFGILLAMAHEWEPRDQWVHSMTLLKNEVMPRLADLD